jgi:hypothetical protein
MMQDDDVDVATSGSREARNGSFLVKRCGDAG